MSDVNNFRAIAISTSLLKLFEHFVAVSLHMNLISVNLDFKSDHNTSVCTLLVLDLGAEARARLSEREFLEA